MASADPGSAPPPRPRSAWARRRELFSARTALGGWELVGEGSYGIVFRVPGDPPRVRKVFVDSSCKVRSDGRWEAEAAALRRAGDLADRRGRPLFPRLIGAGRDRGLQAPFIEMEDGGASAAVFLAARGPPPGGGAPPAAALLRCAKGLLAAVDALHGAGLWHLDLSAMNLLVGKDGRAVLADLGGAGLDQDGVVELSTRVGNFWSWPPELNSGPPPGEFQSAVELLRAAFARYGPTGAPWDAGPPPPAAALAAAREALWLDFRGFAQRVDAFMAGVTIVHMCAIWLEAGGVDLAAPPRDAPPPGRDDAEAEAIVRACLLWAAPMLRAEAPQRLTPAEVLAAWGQAEAAGGAGGAGGAEAAGGAGGAGAAPPP